MLVGSLISSRAPDRYIRPVITFVIFASGLKYVGLGTTALGWTLGIVLVGGRRVYWLAYVRPRRAGVPHRAANPASARTRPPVEATTRARSGRTGLRCTPCVTAAGVRGCDSRASAARR